MKKILEVPKTDGAVTYCDIARFSRLSVNAVEKSQFAECAVGTVAFSRPRSPINARR